MLTTGSLCEGELYQRWCHFWEPRLKIETLPQNFKCLHSKRSLIFHAQICRPSKRIRNSVHFFLFGFPEDHSILCNARTLPFRMGSLHNSNSYLFGICSPVLDFGFLLYISALVSWCFTITPNGFSKQNSV